MSSTRQVLVVLCGVILFCLSPSSAFGSCSAPANTIEGENCLPGVPQSQWDLNSNDAGDPTIQGFSTDISVNVGQTIFFKIDTDAAAYTIDIYRMGYYGGMGARLVTSIQPSAKLPQPQAACLTDASTALVDCGNWTVSASWQIPASAVSGIYFAHLIRTDTGGDSHIVFIVRNDASHSAMLFQTSDETWQAYNSYGGSNFYGFGQTFDLSRRAVKVSYNRPANTRGFNDEAATWVFGSEYPMVRFLEANGYDVTYFTGTDAARNGNLILNHQLYLSNGHDEYWSGPHRNNVEAARNAGVHMAFFSGNEVFWKTRLEPSIDGTNTPNRTLVCYKETLNNAPLDPLDPPTWTGTWRDWRFSPPADGGHPENSLTGTLFMVNGPAPDNPGTLSIQVPSADGRMRFWRNTTVANLTSGQTAILPKGTLGYEWDEDIDNGSRPAGLIRLSTATYNLTTDLLLNEGSIYGAGAATHHLTFYRATSGALVFGAGTVQWAWGLDSNHDNPFFSPNTVPNPAMQQATVNLFADMGIQPASLLAGLALATASTDTMPPTSAIASPSSGASVTTGTSITITGTAADSGGGVVGGVEVSTDGGTTWHPANGRESWNYAWHSGSLGSVTLESRAIDDSGNIGEPSISTITVTPNDCPCTDWTPSNIPTVIDSGDVRSTEVGVRFRADFNGYVTGIRFYKASANSGTHIGNLWSNTGTLLATATFTAETASGWQTVNFSSPVAVTANSTYVASYFAPFGHYSYTISYFANAASDAPPLHFLRDGTDGSDGLYSYSSNSTFPTSTYQSSNYWVDVVYIPSLSMPGAPPALLAYPSTLSFAAFAGAANPAAQIVNVYNEGDGSINWTASSTASWLSVTPSGTTPSSLSILVNSSQLALGNYTATITVTPSGATNGPQTISVSLVVTNLWLSSNFADGTMNGWAFSPLGLASNWSVNNSILQYNGGGHTQVYAGDSGWTDYSVNVGIKLAAMSDYPGGIRGRLNPSTGAGYAVWLYPSEGVVKLFRNSAWNIDTGLVQLGQGNVKFDTANFHNVQLSFSGSEIRVAYDGTTIITATDATYGSGAIALDVSNQVISFRNVMVTSSNTNSGLLTLAPTSMTFTANYGSNPVPQSVQLDGTGGSLVWTAFTSAPWLTVSSAYGATASSPQLSVVSSTLTPGTYNGFITFVALGAAPTTETVNVQLNVTALPPALVAGPSTLNFVAAGSQSVPAQTLVVANGGGWGTFNWMVGTNSSWLSASPGSGATPQSISVSVNPSGLPAGNYSGNVTITAGGVANSPLTVPVTLQVLLSDMNETFQDLASGWIVSPMGLGSGWSVSNGVYSYSGLGFSQSCAGNSGWTDYAFDSNIRLSNLSNWPGGVRGRVNPTTGGGYAVWLYPGLGQMILYSVPQWNINQGGVVQLASAPLSFDATTAHWLRLNFRGTVISVYWDGAYVMSATDSTYSNGYVCFDADTQPISYSNVQVAAVQQAVTLDPVTPSSLVFNSVGGSTPTPQRVNVTAGGASTTWAATTNAAWLTAVASTTLTPGQLTVSVNPTGLAPGSYSGTVSISSPGGINSPLSIPVTITVSASALSVSPSNLIFFAASGQTSPGQSIAVANLGTGSMSWTASNTENWLTLNTASGSAPSSIGVTVNPNSTGVGTFNDTVTVTAPGAANSPASVPVSMQVGSLLFSDSFSSGSGNWTLSPLGNAAGWAVASGAYIYNGGGPSESYAGSSVWTDYTVATDIRLASLNDYPGGLRGRVNTTTGASYGVWVYPTERILKLFRIGQWNIDADLSLLGQSAQLPMDTNWHNLRLVFQGTTIQAYFDNSLAISATDASYSQGGIALDVSNQPISFDNVTVISLP